MGPPQNRSETRILSRPGFGLTRLTSLTQPGLAQNRSETTVRLYYYTNYRTHDRTTPCRITSLGTASNASHSTRTVSAVAFMNGFGLAPRPMNMTAGALSGAYRRQRGAPLPARGFGSQGGCPNPNPHGSTRMLLWPHPQASIPRPTGPGKQAASHRDRGSPRSMAFELISAMGE